MISIFFLLQREFELVKRDGMIIFPQVNNHNTIFLYQGHDSLELFAHCKRSDFWMKIVCFLDVAYRIKMVNSPDRPGMISGK